MTEPRTESGNALTTDVPASPRPPRGPSVFFVIVLFVVLVVGVGGGVIIAPRLANSGGAAAEPAQHDDKDAAAGDHAAYFTCGMHPWVILPEPGICPICRMDLTPLDPDKFSGEVAIDPVIAQSIGVRVEPVISGPVTRTIRTVGSVTYDETRVRDVNIKVEGWIEGLHVDYEGAVVASGDPLFDIYSPRLYSAQEEYLSAVRSRDRAVRLDNPVGAAAHETLMDDARTQLLFFDIQDRQIEELVERGRAAKTIAIRSPHSGVVIAKHANDGMRVEPGMRVYQIADLSTVWVMVSLYEYQTPYVEVGQQAVMTLPYIPGQQFEGRVIYVYPYLEESTRQLAIRLEFENGAGVLKPGMYANIELHSTLASERALVPRAAVIDTGERQVAFVSLGAGRFEPRELRVGVETDGGMMEVLSGLREGEMVVTSGQFLLDSEARLRDSLAKMIRGDLATDAGPASTGPTADLPALPPIVSELLTELLDAYFAIGDRLASDALDSVGDDARTIARSIDLLIEVPFPEDEHFWHRHDEVATIRGESLALLDASDLPNARLHFANLSVALSELLLATGVPSSTQAPVEELHCPMYREGQGGGLWLQRTGQVRNPYFGAVMLECFDARRRMPTAGAVLEDRPDDEPSDQHEVDHQSGPSGEPSASQRDVDALFGAYLAMQVQLTQDDASKLEEFREQLNVAAQRLVDAPEFPAAAAAEAIFVATAEPSDTLEQWRMSFGNLSDAMILLARQSPPALSTAPSLQVTYCPMVKKSWLQVSETVANPYDPTMLRCGTIQETLPVMAGMGTR